VNVPPRTIYIDSQPLTSFGAVITAACFFNPHDRLVQCVRLREARVRVRCRLQEYA
jgi:hypothetical protein